MKKTIQISVSRAEQGFKDIAKKAADKQGVSLSTYIIRTVKASQSYRDQE